MYLLCIFILSTTITLRPQTHYQTSTRHTCLNLHQMVPILLLGQVPGAQVYLGLSCLGMNLRSTMIVILSLQQYTQHVDLLYVVQSCDSCQHLSSRLLKSPARGYTLFPGCLLWTVKNID